MSLTIELDPLTERKLKSAALQRGTSSHAFVINTLKERLDHGAESNLKKKYSVASLLEEINRGMTEAEWSRYRKLSAKRRKETLTRRELAELRDTSNRLECMSARRIELVAELARRRRSSFETEWAKLGIEPKRV